MSPAADKSHSGGGQWCAENTTINASWANLERCNVDAWPHHLQHVKTNHEQPFWAIGHERLVPSCPSFAGVSSHGQLHAASAFSCGRLTSLRSQTNPPRPWWRWVGVGGGSVMIHLTLAQCMSDTDVVVVVVDVLCLCLSCDSATKAHFGNGKERRRVPGPRPKEGRENSESQERTRLYQALLSNCRTGLLVVLGNSPSAQ